MNRNYEVRGGGGGGGSDDGDDSDDSTTNPQDDSGSSGGGGSYEVGGSGPIWERNINIDREDVIGDADEGSGGEQSQNEGDASSGSGAVPGQSRSAPATTGAPGGGSGQSDASQSGSSESESAPDASAGQSAAGSPSGSGAVPGQSRSAPATTGGPGGEDQPLSGSDEDGTPDAARSPTAGGVSGQGPGANPSEPDQELGLAEAGGDPRVTQQARDLKTRALEQTDLESRGAIEIVRRDDKLVAQVTEFGRERQQEIIAADINERLSSKAVNPRAGFAGGSAQAPGTTGPQQTAPLDDPLSADDISFVPDRGTRPNKGATPGQSQGAPATTGTASFGTVELDNPRVDDIDTRAEYLDETGQDYVPNDASDVYQTAPSVIAETNRPWRRDPSWVNELEARAREADVALRSNLLSARDNVPDELRDADRNGNGVPDWAEATRGNDQLPGSDISEGRERGTNIESTPAGEVPGARVDNDIENPPPLPGEFRIDPSGREAIREARVGAAVSDFETVLNRDLSREDVTVTDGTISVTPATEGAAPTAGIDDDTPGAQARAERQQTADQFAAVGAGRSGQAATANQSPFLERDSPSLRETVAADFTEETGADVDASDVVITDRTNGVEATLDPETQAQLSARELESREDVQSAEVVEEDGEFQVRVDPMTGGEQFISDSLGVVNQASDPLVGGFEDVTGIDVPGEGRTLQLYGEDAPREATEGVTGVDFPDDRAEAAQGARETVTGSGDVPDLQTRTAAAPDTDRDLTPGTGDDETIVERWKRRVSTLPGGERATQVAVAGAPVAAAEPTPFGEAGVGAAAGGILVGGAIVASGQQTAQNVRGEQEEIPVGSFFPESELEVNERRQPGELQVPADAERSELGTPTEETPVSGSELDAGSEQFPAELPLETPTNEPERTGGEGSTVVPGDYPLPNRDFPADPSREYVSGERPTLSTSPIQQGIQRQREEADQPTISREDIVRDIGQPDQPAPSNRERQRRDDLRAPERTFPTGGSAVVDGETPTDGTQERLEEAQEPLRGDETTPGAEEGLDLTPGARDRQERAQTSSLREEARLEPGIEPTERLEPFSDAFVRPGQALDPLSIQDSTQATRLDQRAAQQTRGATQQRQRQRVEQRFDQRLQNRFEERTVNENPFGNPLGPSFGTPTGFGPPNPPTTTRRRPRDLDDDRPSRTFDDAFDSSGGRADEDSTATGFLSETVATIATRGQSIEAAEAPDRDTIRDQPDRLSLVGENPTAGFFEADTREDIGEVQDLFGGLDVPAEDDSGGFF